MRAIRFYLGISLLYGLYKGLFLFLHLELRITLPYEALLQGAGFILYMLFSFSVSPAYLKHWRYTFAFLITSVIWTSDIVWIWVYLHMFLPFVMY
ncbi:hypothetical protein MUG87_07345 [Ectobacillus sp. JY-23]|uniref:hypothetical protein n=1 Tax=Ectobacillus sp. JY-23 TaxID=2933872 RepID=UPI001FF4C274|nr:hypothetical protein [Ectobacillus sp. JY-23]UOY93915.1 hypothetical protein MUG87_07345 [Ectobacillus sp. JY-23]